MKFAPSWLRTDPLQFLFDELMDGGHKAYAVGGCVRDAMMGRPCNDIDVSTSRSPEEVEKALSGWEHVKLLPTGVAHGTWTAVIEGQSFEVTSFRKDVATDGRRAAVEFSRSVEDDAFRRDFNMNALYMDRDGKIVDPTGKGVADCMQRIVRFVGDAGERCREDYLRILRLFRFHAHLGVGTMDDVALEAARLNARGLIDHVSGERIWSEVKKLLSASNPTDAIIQMERVGVLGYVLPGMNRITGLSACVTAEQLKGLDPRWQRRYLSMAPFATPDIPYPHARAEMDALTKAFDASWVYHEPEAMGYVYGETVAVDVDVLQETRTGRVTGTNHTDRYRKGAATPFPMTAADLQRKGITPGPQLGALLREAEKFFVSSNLTLSRQELLEKVLPS